MTRIKTLAVGFLSLVVSLGLLGSAGWLVYGFIQYIKAVPKELGPPLVAGATTILVATVTVMVGRYYERRKELDALYRDKKTEIYDEFLKEFFGFFFDSGAKGAQATSKDLVPFLQEFIRKLVLWSGPEVIESFVAWKEHLARGEPDARSIFLTEALLRAIRADLRHSNRGLRRGFFARLFLKEGDLFLEQADKDPHLTLAALAIIERKMRGAQSTETVV